MPPIVLTVTSTVVDPAGAWARIEVGDLALTLAAGRDPNHTALAWVKLLPVMLTQLPPCEGPARGETLVTPGGFDAAEAAGRSLGNPRPVPRRSTGVATATIRRPRYLTGGTRTASAWRGAGRRRLLTRPFLLGRVTG